MKFIERARRARSQGSKYSNDARVPKRNIFALCFHAIGFSKNELIKNYDEGIKKWKVRKKDELEKLDFYGIIEVSSKVKKIWCHYDDQDDLYFPALVIYGMVNPYFVK